MSELKISIQQPEDIEWLIQAANDVSSATEADFTALKEKHWYKRLWETVTFSKENQIHVAKDVSSLAKLQELIIRLILLVSSNSAEISDLVRENSERIAKLSVVDTLLLKEIQKIKYGCNDRLEFDALDQEKKSLFVTLIAKADPVESTSESAKQYMSALMTLAGITTIADQWSSAALDDLAVEECELLYRMIMIHRHLMTVPFDAESAVLEEIALKPRKKREIQDEIVDTAHFVSSDFFITFYERDDINCDFIEENGFAFEDCSRDAFDEQAFETAEQEELWVTEIIHVQSGETKTFRHKNIHVQSIIHCEGHLHFENCTIHCGEDAGLGSIKLGAEASLSAQHCTFECHSAIQGAFIKAEHTPQLQFNTCEFLNCGNFIEGGELIEVKNTDFVNPWKQLIVNAKQCVFEKSEFYFDVQPFDAEAGWYIIGCSVLNMVKCYVKGADGYRLRGFVKAYESVIEHSSFVNIERLIALNYGSAAVSQTTFIDCNNIFENYHVKAKNCTFNTCSAIALHLADETIFSHCKFANCVGALISSSQYGITLEFCEFIKWHEKPIYDEKNDLLLSVLYSPYKSMLTFERHPGKEYIPSKIDHCVFQEIHLETNYIVSASFPGFLKQPKVIVANITSCMFSNCTTQREDGCIIQDIEMWPTLKGLLPTKTVSIKDCHGLEE